MLEGASGTILSTMHTKKAKWSAIRDVLEWLEKFTVL
jgi:hypothetical protein